MTKNKQALLLLCFILITAFLEIFITVQQFVLAVTFRTTTSQLETQSP